MSSPDKVELLAKAQQLGYKTYLYYVATADPEINVSRVKMRYEDGGHGVPVEKILVRYERSLDLLYDAYQNCNRGYFFDNSREGADSVLIAKAEGLKVTIETDKGIPPWFDEALLDKIRQQKSPDR